jgi:hypothetical protein
MITLNFNEHEVRLLLKLIRGKEQIMPKEKQILSYMEAALDIALSINCSVVHQEEVCE